MIKEKKYSFSVISHNQKDLVLNLIDSIEKLVTDYEIILTNNTTQEISSLYKKKNIKIIQNKTIKGFGTNHNYAFNHSSGLYFIVINPDIVITRWPKILNLEKNNIYTGIVIDETGYKADNIRGFPSIPNLFTRYIKLKINYKSIWFAGMLLILHKDDYKNLNGFDDRFFMYLEDTDLCLRAKHKCFNLIENKNLEVIHDCRRYSRKKLKYLLIHLKSLLFFYYKHPMAIFKINP